MENSTEEDFKHHHERISSALIDTTKAAALVANEDVTFLRAANRDVGIALDDQSQRLLGLASRLIRKGAAATSHSNPAWESMDDLESNWRNGIDVIDSMLERADLALDRHTGKTKNYPTEVSMSIISVLETDFSIFHRR
jgi:exosome complex exonuclease RRP6